MQENMLLRRYASLVATAVLVFGATGCARVSELSRDAVERITPYRADVVQGNFVSQQQLDALQPGMSRAQVREILGTPLLTSVFHGQRWDYVFTIRRQGVQDQNRRLSVFFKGDSFERTEGDALPSEEAFVASLGKPLTHMRSPQLEATPEQLASSIRDHTPAAEHEAVNASSAPSAQPRSSYPPLE